MNFSARTIFAPAKINLGLKITGRYANGYHRLETVFAATSLYDRIEISSAPADRVMHIWPRGTSAGLRQVLERGALKNPLTKKTIAFARDALGGKLGPIAVRIEKRIPSPSGLGGASADAAALLQSLLPQVTPEILRASEALGADVPYFLFAGLAGNAAKLDGIGHELTPVDLPPCCGFLAVPAFGFSTEKMFAHVRTLPLPQASAAAPANSKLALRLDEIPISDEVQSGVKIVHNDFDAIARQVFPRESEFLAQGRRVIARTLRQALPVDWYIGLTGSGAGQFAITDSFLTRDQIAKCSSWLNARLGPGWQVKSVKIGP